METSEQQQQIAHPYLSGKRDGTFLQGHQLVTHGTS